MREKRMIWQEFCYDLIEAREKDTTEDVYQELVESNLRQLGWSKVRGEICPKERINVGSHNQIEPDITIKLSDQPAFVIELKRPRNAITPRQEQQLLSYMRLRKTSFGLYKTYLPRYGARTSPSTQLRGRSLSICSITILLADKG